jgi:hypothetical protein
MAVDDTIALQGNMTAPRPLDFSLATPLEAANKIQTGQTNLQMLNRQNQGQNIQFNNQLIANAAAHAMDADSWDAAMQKAVKQGATEAGQYVGRYTPLLQQRLYESYSGAPPAAQGAAPGASGAPASGAGVVGGPTDQYDRLFQNVAPDKMAASLQRLNMVNDALTSVRDPQSWDAAIQKLSAAGIPQAQQFAGAYSPLRVQQLWQSIQPIRAYLQDRAAAEATGVPDPLVKKDTFTVGGNAFDQYTGKQVTPTEWKTTEVTDAFGQKHSVAYDPQNPNRTVSVRPTPPDASTSSPSPFDAFAKKMDGAENSTGNPAAKNPLSSATGNGQFLDSTWLNMVKSARPDLAKGRSDEQILAMRADPALSQDMTAAYARQNAAELNDKGLPVTSASLALAHRFGAEGASTILKAPQTALLSDILPASVIKANPSLKGVTAGQYAAGMVKQFGNSPVNAIQTPKMEDFDASNVDPNLSGWDYAAQFPVEVQDAAKAYMNGSVMPTGNTRNIGIATMAKTVAQKVANDLGRPELADDTLYGQRRQMQTELAKTTAPAALGGQITFGGTALGHLAQYSEDLAALHNDSGWMTPIGHALNAVGSIGNAQSEKINQASGDAQHYGQEIAKFYGGGPGGVAERERFLNASASMNPATATPQEMAGMIRAERNLIPERYAQIKANIENILGLEAATHAIARINIPGSMDRINHSLAILDPTGPEARAEIAAGTAKGVTADNPEDKQRDKGIDMLKTVTTPQAKPTADDIAYAKAHPEYHAKFLARFGVEP